MKKESLYYYDVGNIHRPNKQELTGNIFNCPKCKNVLSRPSTQILTEIYICPNCGFKIEIQKILTKENIQDAIQKKHIRLHLDGEAIVEGIIANKR